MFEPAVYEAPTARIVEDVFRTMLGMEVAARTGAPAAAAGTITAAIQFVGEWKGALLLQCGLSQALEFTRRLMPGIQPAAFDGDVRDALGELANMMGGNLKSVLPQGVGLAIPLVVEGTDFAMHICGGNESASQTFSGEVGDFGVTLVHVVEKCAD
jgi:CheY-specific phosphatase CheX